MTGPDYGDYAEAAARPGAQLFAALTGKQVNMVAAIIRSSTHKLEAVHGTGEHWHEFFGVLDDLHGAWALVFERENPGQLARNALVDRWAALGLEPVDGAQAGQWGAPVPQGPLPEHPTDPLNPMSDLVPACGWDCVAVHPHGPAGAVDAWDRGRNGAAA